MLAYEHGKQDFVLSCLTYAASDVAKATSFTKGTLFLWWKSSYTKTTYFPTMKSPTFDGLLISVWIFLSKAVVVSVSGRFFFYFPQ